MSNDTFEGYPLNEEVVLLIDAAISEKATNICFSQEIILGLLPHYSRIWLWCFPNQIGLTDYDGHYNHLKNV